MASKPHALSWLATIAALGLALTALPDPAWATQVTCESRNNQRAECPIDTRGEVRVVRQLSKTRCEEGRNWGAGRGVVWVQSGCRAVFEATATGSGGNAGNGAREVTCESRGNRYEECAMDTGGRVVIVRELGGTRCVQNRNWGTEAGHVWVSGGCGAVFRSARGVGPGGAPGAEIRQVTCESRNNRQVECPMNTTGGVRLVRQLSSAACTQGRTWGTARDHVWVRGGCRGVFESERGGTSPGALPSVTDCASRNNRRTECPLDTRYGVRYQQRLGNAPCDDGVSWGLGDGFVWVDRGCHGRFAAGLPDQPGPGALPRQATCESRNNRYQECPLQTRGGVRLVRRLSDARCEEGESWGVNWNAVWVDRGCRAQFESSNDGLPSQLPGQPGGRQVTCESRNNRYHQCAMDTRDGVRLVRRLSDARCEEGSSWGVTRDAVWVDRGCRAVFEAGYR